MLSPRTRVLAFVLPSLMGALGLGVSSSAQTLSPAMQAAVATAQPAAIAAPGATVPGTATPEAPQSPVTPTGDASAVRMFRGHPEDDLLRDMASRPVVRVIERFNSSTLVFHCDLGNGVEIAFKPARRGERHWWQHEVSGYELARALGVEGRVPPAVYRRVPVAVLDGFLRDANLDVKSDGTVEGAAIFWMPVLRRTNLHTAEAREQWNPWLDPRQPIPAESRTRAMQIASLIVFDYLQANFDRWNAANVPQDENGDLVFRDNNRAWFEVNLRRLDRGGIEGIRRLPASLLAAVERTTGEVLARRTVRVRPHLLNAAQVREYDNRRHALLARVHEAEQEYGRDNVTLDDASSPVARLTDDVEAPATPASPTATSPDAGERRHGHHDRHGHHHEGGAHHGRHHSQE